MLEKVLAVGKRSEESEELNHMLRQYEHALDLAVKGMSEQEITQFQIQLAKDTVKGLVETGFL